MFSKGQLTVSWVDSGERAAEHHAARSAQRLWPSHTAVYPHTHAVTTLGCSSAGCNRNQQPHPVLQHRHVHVVIGNVVKSNLTGSDGMAGCAHIATHQDDVWLKNFLITHHLKSLSLLKPKSLTETSGFFSLQEQVFPGKPFGNEIPCFVESLLPELLLWSASFLPPFSGGCCSFCPAAIICLFTSPLLVPWFCCASSPKKFKVQFTSIHMD